MPDQAEPQRCRLVLVLPQGYGPERADDLRAALAAGDVASVILPQFDMQEVHFQALAEALVPVIQQAGAAAIIAGETRVAGRVGADGVHVEASPADVADVIERNGGRLIVGAGGATTRDAALELGEAQPDYIFFGRFGYDNKAEPHRRNLALGQWWAEMVEIPCLVLGGSELASVVAVAATGAEFVALSSAVFGHPDGATAGVAEANRLLEDAAPRLSPGTTYVA